MKEIDFYARDHKDEINGYIQKGIDYIEAVTSTALAFFKKHGFTVSDQAIIHNVEAWTQDYKSGYLDEENGVHLFSPCGCNPLRISASEYVGEDWQTTYIA